MDGSARYGRTLIKTASRGAALSRGRNVITASLKGAADPERRKRDAPFGKLRCGYRLRMMISPPLPFNPPPAPGESRQENFSKT